MIQEIMSMSTDEIKERFDHTKKVDSNNIPLLDALYYCYYLKSKKTPSNKERFQRLEKQFRIEIEDDGKYEGQIDFKFLQKQKEQREVEHFEFDKDKNFVKVSSGVLNMPRIKKSLRNPTSLLLYLLQWKGYGEKKGLTGKWYKKGFIVASQSVEQMAYEFQVSERCIRKWILALEDDGLLLVEKSGLFNVYVLGQVNKKTGKEKYFYCGDIQPYRKPERKGKEKD